MSISGREAHADLREQIIEILPRLRRYCMMIAANRDDGDDLCQSTIERALSKSSLFVLGTRLDSWMFKIAHNILRDRIRWTKVRGTEIEVDDALGLIGDDGQAIVDARSDLAQARNAIANLSIDQRTLMALIVVEGKSYREAADILEVPIGTIMSRMARARQAVETSVRGEKGQANDG